MKKATRRWKNQWDHGCVGWERVTRKWFSFLCWRGEMKYKKQAGGLKFEIKVGPKTFETGERTVENSWLTGKLTGRPAFAMVDELFYLNDVSWDSLRNKPNHHCKFQHASWTYGEKQPSA